MKLLFSVTEVILDHVSFNKESCSIVFWFVPMYTKCLLVISTYEFMTVFGYSLQ